MAEKVQTNSFIKFEKFLKTKFPEITDTQLAQFEAMEEIYKDWNAKINVISRKDIDNIYEHHIMHSLAIAGYLKENKKLLYNELQEEKRNFKILDLGTGGGFPGIPLAILFPNVEFTLCDSIKKKTIVAEAAAESLNLKNVTVVNGRAEKLKDIFDFVVSRAVTDLSTFYPWVRTKFTQNIFYLKGGDINTEIADLEKHHHISRTGIHSWDIENWTKDEFYKDKMVIDIERTACPGKIKFK